MSVSEVNPRTNICRKRAAIDSRIMSRDSGINRINFMEMEGFGFGSDNIVDIGFFADNMTSNARAILWESDGAIFEARMESNFANCSCMTFAPCFSMSSRTLSRTSSLGVGMSCKPRVREWKYIMVPPINNGVLPRATMSDADSEASRQNIPALKDSFGLQTSIK